MRLYSAAMSLALMPEDLHLAFVDGNSMRRSPRVSFDMAETERNRFLRLFTTIRRSGKETQFLEDLFLGDMMSW